jgi:flagellar basal body-associated protein FliL
MDKKILISLIVVIVLLVVIAIGIGVYYFVFRGNTGFLANNTNNEQNPGEIKILTPEQQDKKIEKEYAETVDGIINFLDKGEVLKTTLTTNAGKVYILSPAEPKSVYESLGAKDGKRVQVRAKSLSGDYLEWKMLKPL